MNGDREKTFLTEYTSGLKACIDEVAAQSVEEIVDLLMEARSAGKQVFILGNGGSAATASHMACDLAKTASVDGETRLRVISLTDNVPLMTAISNDISYEQIFVEQMRNLLNPGDVVIAITSSGDSPNVIEALKFAKEKKATAVGLLGFGGGKARELVDRQITISSTNYGHIEDVHMMLNHVITAWLKARIELEAT